MDHIAPDPDTWTMPQLGEALFQYCFPDDLRHQMRIKFNNLTQDRRKLVDFVQELRSLAHKIPNIDERQVALRLWDGADQRI